MPGRNVSTANYRYGFNGKEQDVDIKPGFQDYGMRVYDALSGRFWSVDPLTRKYPELSPYQFASSRPIDGVDLNGLEYLDIEKYNQSIWGLSKFERTSSAYTVGPLQIRNREIHNIVVNHPDNSHIWEAGLEEPSEANDMVVKKRSSSHKAQAFSDMEARTARREGAAEVVEGIVDAIKWGIKTGYNIKFNKELDYAGASIAALNKADNLVRAAAKIPTFPQNLSSSSAVLADLVNYITDFTLPEGANFDYRQIIKAWGDLLFNNDVKISNGTFNFSPLKTEIKKVVLSGPSDMKIDLGVIEETTGNPDPALNKANELIKDKKPDRPAVVSSAPGG